MYNNDYKNMIDYIKNDFEVVSDKEWGLSHIPFSENLISDDIIRDMKIQDIARDSGYNLSIDEIKNEENEVGLHVYWDKVNHPESIEIGLYIYGSGDFEVHHTLKDIVSPEVYQELYDFGYQKLYKEQNSSLENNEIELE